MGSEMNMVPTGFKVQVYSESCYRWINCVKYVDANGFERPYASSTGVSVPAHYLTRQEAENKLQELLSSPAIQHSTYRLVATYEVEDTLLGAFKGKHGEPTAIVG